MNVLKKKQKKKKGDPDLFLLWWGGTMAVRVYNQSRSSTPAAISIPDGSLATKLKTSQQVSVICCESWALWRKHLKRSAGDGCLLFLLKSISRLTLPLLPWWMCLCVCACNKATQTHTHAQTDGNTRCNRKKKKKSQWVIHAGLVPTGLPVWGVQVDAGGVEDGGWRRGGRELESLWLTNVPLLTFKLLWAGDWSILRTSTKNSSTARDRNAREDKYKSGPRNRF